MRKQGPCTPEEQRQECGEVTASDHKDGSHWEQHPHIFILTWIEMWDTFTGHSARHVWHAQSKRIDWLTKEPHVKALQHFSHSFADPVLSVSPQTPNIPNSATFPSC